MIIQLYCLSFLMFVCSMNVTWKLFEAKIVFKLLVLAGNNGRGRSESARLNESAGVLQLYK